MFVFTGCVNVRFMWLLGWLTRAWCLTHVAQLH